MLTVDNFMRFEDSKSVFEVIKYDNQVVGLNTNEE